MSTTVASAEKQETTATRAINSLYISGLILDLMSASLAFLTSRWLQRLSSDEKELLEKEFDRQARETGREKLEVDEEKGGEEKGGEEKGGEEKAKDSKHLPRLHRLVYAWFSMSLFVPLPLLVLGVWCMLLGIYVYTWTQQPTVVAVIVTLAGIGTLPFLLGVFLIGREKGRRRVIIRRLSNMQGDW
jgi:hypothetical protein